MTGARDTMELREETIRAQYDPALSLLTGFDHAPRLARAAVVEAKVERSPGIGTRPMFRSTTPGIVTRSTARPGGVRLLERVESLGDGLVSPVQASALHSLRRGLAIALAMAETFAAQSGLAELKKANFEGRLPEGKRSEFTDLLAAEALMTLYTFANATAFLLAPSMGSTTVEVGAVEEILTDNAPLALQGALWELDQDIALLSGDEPRLIAVIGAFCEALMQRVALRAEAAPGLQAFTGGAWQVEADALSIAGFKPARAAKGGALTMQFKKPSEVVGNHIAKYQSLRLAKMLMAYDFERKFNPFAELGGFIYTFMGDGKPGTGKTTLIQMMAGLLNDYCKAAGYPFRYR
ncbi:MAG: AAA family ATPase, partial [Rhodobacterales bacterium 17-64-5]